MYVQIYRFTDSKVTTDTLPFQRLICTNIPHDLMRMGTISTVGILNFRKYSIRLLPKFLVLTHRFSVENVFLLKGPNQENKCL